MSKEKEKFKVLTYDKNYVQFIPKFDGNPFQFEFFITRFEDLVGNTNAPSYTKLFYLEENLTKDFVSKISSTSYKLALKKFKDIFRSKTERLSYLKDIDAVEDPKNFEDLKTTIYELQCVNRSIEYFSLNASVEMELLKKVLKMFPTKYVKEYLRNTEYEDITISGFLEYMEDTVEKEESYVRKLEIFDLNNESSSGQQYSNYVEYNDTGEFYLSHLSPEQRIRKIKKRNLCMNCLKKNHKAFNCRMKNNCEHCPKKHHTLLCEKTQSIKYRKLSDTNYSSDSESD